MEEALIKRILPHSIEAEQSVIGSMLLDRDAILIASEILTSDDFYQNQYGIIFDAMVELCNEGKPVDTITLQNRLKEKDVPPDISSMEYVRERLEAVPPSANVCRFIDNLHLNLLYIFTCSFTVFYVLSARIQLYVCLT